MEVSHIAKQKGASSFACAVNVKKNASVQVFDPSSPLPKDTCFMRAQSFGLAFHKNGVLTYLDRSFELSRISPAKVERVAEPLPILQNTAPKSVFNSIYGTNFKATPTKKVANASTISTNVLGFLQVPSHIIAPPSKLGTTILESLLAGLSEVHPVGNGDVSEITTTIDYATGSAMDLDDETSIGIVENDERTDVAATEMETLTIPESYSFLNDVMSTLIINH
jgi:hypothetical protein